MKIYIIIAWTDTKKDTNPAILTTTNKTIAIEKAKVYEEFYKDYPNKKILIRCDEPKKSYFVDWEGVK